MTIIYPFQAQLSLNLKSSVNSVDSSATNSLPTTAGPVSQGSRTRNQRRRSLLRDQQRGSNWMDAESSISLDYSEKFDNPRESISHLLKAQLSIDVRGSSESSQPPSVKGKVETGWCMRPEYGVIL